PCTNLDHLNNYEMSNRQLANCNHCRVEQQTADEDHYPHIANATAAQIGALPPRLQRWVEQFRDGEPVGDQDERRRSQQKGHTQKCGEISPSSYPKMNTFSKNNYLRPLADCIQ